MTANNSSKDEGSSQELYHSQKERLKGNRTVDDLSEAISPDRFSAWYQERQFRQNIENGQPYFNSSSPVPEPTRHSPSNLLQCHRKLYYRQYNAPEEQSDPDGIYWFGTRFEEDIICPFLERAVTGPDTYVRNSIWVDFTVETQGLDIQIKGVTDPVMVDSKSVPILPTEIKSKSSVEGLKSPNKQHRAQIHAYMAGLSTKYEIQVRDAILIYGSRNSFRINPFHIEFDEEFWETTVLQWAADHTQYRLNEQLPPAEPSSSWECKYCDYRERCGKGNSGFTDIGVSELLPRFVEYPRQNVVEFLDANPTARLPPTLAHEYPDLADSYGVYQWQCPQCSSRFDWDQLEQDSGNAVEWFCPRCLEQDSLVELQVPTLSDGLKSTACASNASKGGSQQ